MTRKSKYIGGFSGEAMRPVSAAQVKRIIRANKQYGNERDARIACMRILDRGESLGDGSGYSIRRGSTT